MEASHTILSVVIQPWHFTKYFVPASRSDKVALGQVFVRVFRICPARFIFSKTRKPSDIQGMDMGSLDDVIL